MNPKNLVHRQNQNQLQECQGNRLRLGSYCKFQKLMDSYQLNQVLNHHLDQKLIQQKYHQGNRLRLDNHYNFL